MSNDTPQNIAKSLSHYNTEGINQLNQRLHKHGLKVIRWHPVEQDSVCESCEWGFCLDRSGFVEDYHSFKREVKP